jgi:DNA-binding XRE family transcriptional regulator
MSANTRTSHDVIERKILANPDVQAAVDALEPEYQLARELIRARIQADKTQQDVAQAMHTTASTVSRIESAGGKKNHSPSYQTLIRYAKAVGCRLQLKLIPLK